MVHDDDVEKFKEKLAGGQYMNPDAKHTTTQPHMKIVATNISESDWHPSLSLTADPLEVDAGNMISTSSQDIKLSSRWNGLPAPATQALSSSITDSTPQEIQINVKELGPSELKLQITICTDKTALDLKRAVAEKSDLAEAGDLQLSYEIERLRDKITKLEAHDAMLVTLIEKEELTGDAQELRFVQTSKPSVTRELRESCISRRRNITSKNPQTVSSPIERRFLSLVRQWEKKRENL
ncbi:hypothetical protein EV702DRAFT_1212250 [Suillus placidus]|uniref:Uncharacterized protein n=1 Tax=Suillus placidus TaxID=48579 RepID=A0A9P6ZHZ1_9AGAM|nr:hypothetical protein EV702DRAFT_1212250 [Suillus placidus]